MSPRQRGFLSLVAVAIIVVLGFFAVALSYLYLANVGAGGLHTSSAQAMFLAESGLERATKRYAGGLTCDTTSLAETQNLGDPSQTFTVVSAALVNGLCRIRVTGSTGNATRTIEGDVSAGGGGFVEQFAYASTAAMNAVWPEYVFWPFGSSGYDPANNCPASTCPLTNTASGSFLARTGGGNGTVFYALRLRTLPAPVAAGTSVTVSFGFRITGNPAAAYTAIWLYDSSSGNAIPLLEATDSPASWQLRTATLTLPASFDSIMMVYGLQKNGGAGAQTHIDEIRLNTGGNGGAKIVAWREIEP